MNFEQLNLAPELDRGIKKLEFTSLTRIQEEVIPVMRDGRDVVGLAPTGSGKTFAFGIPVIENIDRTSRDVQALILCPTRELAVQIESELKKLTEYVEGIRFACLYGGQNFQRQLYTLRKKPQIIVGTTGRIIDHLGRRTIDLSTVRTIVLDEADEMLDMGFRPDIDEIFSYMGPGLQVVMFSATMSKEIGEISAKYQYNPITVKDDTEKNKPDIKQYHVRIKENEKIGAMLSLIEENGYKLVLAFCNTKNRVDDLERKLYKADTGLSVGALHGDMRQRHRDAVMKSFKKGELNVLIATDVAARGIDVSGIDAVFNYDPPQTEEFYVHRIGRTARAGKKGIAYTFLTKPYAFRLKDYEKYIGESIPELKLSCSDGFEIKERINSKANESEERLFLNLGSKDGFDEKKLRAYLIANCDLDDKDISGVKIAELYSFVNVVKKSVMRVLALSGKKEGKRRVSVEKAGERKQEQKPVKKVGEIKKDRYQKEKPADRFRTKPSAKKQTKEFSGRKNTKSKPTKDRQNFSKPKRKGR
ncbi:MAG: DEAD/DEAH box helicase [Clostridia bacterium]|nr:DEAD/DEAH box helicase [Clostridia bacterium]